MKRGKAIAARSRSLFFPKWFAVAARCQATFQNGNPPWAGYRASRPRVPGLVHGVRCFLGSPLPSEQKRGNVVGVLGTVRLGPC